MILRFATKKDLPQILQIEKSAFAEEIQESEKSFFNRIETFQKGFVVFENEDLTKDLKSENHIFGYFSSEMFLEIPQAENAFKMNHDIKKSHHENGKILYISSFAILKEFCGKGLGKEAFSKSIDFILQNQKNVKTLLLLVNENWKSAIHIYKNYGFCELKIFKNFFSSQNKKSNAILMKKDL